MRQHDKLPSIVLKNSNAVAYRVLQLRWWACGGPEYVRMLPTNAMRSSINFVFFLLTTPQPSNSKVF